MTNEAVKSLEGGIEALTVNLFELHIQQTGDSYRALIELSNFLDRLSTKIRSAYEYNQEQLRAQQGN